MNSSSRFAAFITLTFSLAVAGCRSTPLPDDNALNSALQARLTGDKAIGSEPIQTFVQGGVATLQGAVSSEAAKALAASDASQVPGIKSVANQLTVQTAQAAQAEPLPMPQVAAASQPIQSPPARQSKPSPRVEARPRPTRNEPASNPASSDQPAPVDRRPLTPSSQPDQQASAAASPLEHRQTAPTPPVVRNVTLPAGTALPVRITQTLDSATTQQGDAFSGALANDVVIDGIVALPAGTNVSGKVDEVHEAAHFKGAALLTISLVSVSRRGDRISVATEPFTKEGQGRGKNTAEKVGGGAAVGAILGGIFGGGKGAAIGAATGGGIGAGAQGISRGQQVQIPSETIVRFRLTSPVDVRATPVQPGESDTNLQHRDSN